MKSNSLKTSTLIFFGVSAAVHAGLFYAWYDDIFAQKSSGHPRSIAVSIQTASLPEMVIESTPEPDPVVEQPVIQPLDKDILLADNSTLKTIAAIDQPVIEPEPVPKPVVKKTARPEKKIAVKPEPKPDPVIEAIEQVAQAQQALITSDSSQPVKSAGAGEADGKSDYLEYLYQKIKDKKFYPAKAKRWRAEGRVTVAFSIERDGSIRDLTINESSGNRHLDKAALATIRQTRPLKHLPASIQADRWDLTIPIEYLLTQ